MMNGSYVAAVTRQTGRPFQPVDVMYCIDNVAAISIVDSKYVVVVVWNIWWKSHKWKVSRRDWEKYQLHREIYKPNFI